MTTPVFQEIPFSRYRVGADDLLRLTSDRTVIHGLIDERTKALTQGM